MCCSSFVEWCRKWQNKSTSMSHSDKCMILYGTLVFNGWFAPGNRGSKSEENLPFFHEYRFDFSPIARNRLGTSYSTLVSTMWCFETCWLVFFVFGCLFACLFWIACLLACLFVCSFVCSFVRLFVYFCLFVRFRVMMQYVTCSSLGRDGYNRLCCIQNVKSNVHNSCSSYFEIAYLTWSRFTLDIQVQVPFCSYLIILLWYFLINFEVLMI